MKVLITITIEDNTTADESNILAKWKGEFSDVLADFAAQSTDMTDYDLKVDPVIEELEIEEDEEETE